MNYQDTDLWKTSLDNDLYGNGDLRDKLKKEYIKIRENAACILSKIRDDFPSLTVHDITHVDSLWQTGSVLVGDDYELTPLEGFVLGCAFLFHDAVLSYEAAGGKEKLQNTKEWMDYYADYKDNENLTEEERMYEADFSTIRLLHAKYAEKLYKQLFQRDDGSSFYIIENEEIRNHMGDMICRIAASHHWSIEQVESLGIQTPAPYGYPREWRINPLKLACILRCADAAHIDAGRAPDYLLKLLKVNGVSRNHWIAQNRLLQIDTFLEDEDKVIIKSDIAFTEEEFAAWNVVYDAVCVLDQEIKASNELLKKHRIKQFKAKGVVGAEAQSELAKYIETDGWIPCEATVHISNTEELIKNLGGEKLYGSDHKLEIVLRELIQNGRDAICARRGIEDSFEGKISINIDLRDGERWVTVKDDGIGMSLDGIKNYLLNFGSSYWASDLAKSEYPGLKSSGFKSVGRFGIGFYAIFMVASKVIVESRRYDKGLDDSVQIKFPNGLCLRPILSKKRSLANSYSTMISFCIDDKKCKWNEKTIIKTGMVNEEAFKVPYSAVLARLTAGLDVDVYYCEDGANLNKIHSNLNHLEIGSQEALDWLKEITYSKYRGENTFADYIDRNHKRLRKVFSAGKYYGIAALNTFWNPVTSCFGVTTIGGLDTFSHSSDSEFLGCIIAESDTAKRDGNIRKIDKKDWAFEQYRILCEEGLSVTDRIRLPYILGKYGVDMTETMIVRVFDREMNQYAFSLNDLLSHLQKKKKTLVLPLSEMLTIDRIDNYLDYERTCKMLGLEDYLFIVEQNSGFLSVKEDDDEFPFNIVHCIKRLAYKNGMTIMKKIENDKAESRFGGKCRGLLISLE